MKREIAYKKLEEKIPSPKSCCLSVGKSGGYILSSPVFAQIDLPPFDKSAMDGYAIFGKEEKSQLEVVDLTAAGQAPSDKLASGNTVQILTGAPVPKGAGKVVPQEFVRREDDKICLKCDLREIASNICVKGEDIKSGDFLYSVGTRISPCKLATMAYAGVSHVNVFAKPSVCVITTGSEVASVGTKKSEYGIYNANAELLQELLSKETTKADHFHLGDDYKQTKKFLNDKIDKYDFLIFTGGASVGKFDFVKQALSYVGAQEIFSGLSIKPARPTGCYFYQNKFVFSLPGNPVAVYLAYLLFVLPVLRAMQGRSYSPFNKVKIAQDLPVKRSKRESFIPVKFTKDGVSLLEYNGPADIFHLSFADGFLQIPPEITVLNGQVNVLRF